MSIVAACVVPHPPLLIPGVGDPEKQQVLATKKAYEQVGSFLAELMPQTIVLFSPHATMLHDYFHISPGKGAQGCFDQFGTRGAEQRYQADYDTEFAQTLAALAQDKGIPAGGLRERMPQLDHGTMVPWHFIAPCLREPALLVRVGLSGRGVEDHFAFGACVANTAEALCRRTVVVASGDLSHRLTREGPYGYAEQGPQFDRQVVEILASGNLSGLLAFDDDFLEQAAECGLRSFIMMAGALDASTVKPDLLSYEGPFGVGYAVATFLVENDGITAAPPFPVALARATLEAYFATGRRPHSGTSGIVETIMQAQGSSSDSECVRDLAGRKAGAFVSLHKEGELRGCIGTISATTGNVIDEIIQNAVSAAVEDPRFPPLSEPELSGLEIKVDVLNEPETVDSASRLDAKRFGVIVSKGFRRGLLLPDLEGVDTPELQLAIALRKAGILPDEDYQIERFEVIRYQ